MNLSKLIKVVLCAVLVGSFATQSMQAAEKHKSSKSSKSAAKSRSRSRVRSGKPKAKAPKAAEPSTPADTSKSTENGEPTAQVAFLEQELFKQGAGAPEAGVLVRARPVDAEGKPVDANGKRIEVDSTDQALRLATNTGIAFLSSYAEKNWQHGLAQAPQVGILAYGLNKGKQVMLSQPLTDREISKIKEMVNKLAINDQGKAVLIANLDAKQIEAFLVDLKTWINPIKRQVQKDLGEASLKSIATIMSMPRSIVDRDGTVKLTPAGQSTLWRSSVFAALLHQLCAQAVSRQPGSSLKSKEGLLWLVGLTALKSLATYNIALGKDKVNIDGFKEGWAAWLARIWGKPQEWATSVHDLGAGALGYVNEIRSGL